MDVDVACGIGKSSTASDSADENSEGGDFECNICFDKAEDPVVTLCGHLYCWPCLYQWLCSHFYSLECPVCKAVIEEEKLVPIYGRGKGSSNPRPELTTGVRIPNRPVGQRPPTAPPVRIPYFREEEPSPTGPARFRNLTLSAFHGMLPAIFCWQGNGIQDGTTSRIPHVFGTSFHGGYADGFYHHGTRIDGEHSFMKMFLLFLIIFIIINLIF